MNDTIKYILEALRQKPIDPGVTRTPGHPIRRMAGNISGVMQDSNTDTNYKRYVKMQTDMGESPVSYQEWLNHAS